MRLLVFGISLTMVAAAIGADTVTLKNGRVATGSYLGGTARDVKIDIGGQVQTFEVADIARIEFDTDRETHAPAAWVPAGAATALPAGTSSAAAGASIELPAGTNLVIRMIDGVDSERNSVGQSFAASLDQPVMINGQTVIPRGADVVVKLVDAKESGKLTGRTSLTLALMSVKVNGSMIDVNTQTVKEESSSRGARTAKMAGGTAALGGIIGAIAGRGKGAAIGLGSGAAVGAAAEVLTKGQRVKIPSETRLTFVLENAVRI